MADNIEYDAASGDIYSGSVPRPLAALKAMRDGVGSVPGGLQLLRRSASSGSRPKFDVESDVCSHSGELMSQVSSALLVGGGHGGRRVAVMGSPTAQGVLVCSI